jgi:hypothetical protein
MSGGGPLGAADGPPAPDAVLDAAKIESGSAKPFRATLPRG